MFVYTEPVYPRRTAEKLFKQAYNLGTVLNFGALVITVTQFASRLNSTYTGYFSNSRYQLTDSLTTVLNNCPVTVWTYTQNGVSVPSALDVNSCPFVFMTTTNLILSILIMHGMLTLTDAMAKLCFSMNVRHLRVRALHFPLSTILVGGTHSLSVIVIALIAVTQNSRDFVQSFVSRCATSYQQTSNAAFLASENDSNVVFGLNFALILAATCINMFFLIVAGFVYISDASRSENGQMVKEQYPWESGFFCKPCKPILVAWCEWRRGQEEAIATGQPRPQITALEAAADAQARDEEDRRLILQNQLAENAFARGLRAQRRHGAPTSPNVAAAQHQQHQAAAGPGSRAPPELPADWGTDGDAVGDEFYVEDEFQQDGGVGADYVNQSRKKHKHRRDRDRDRYDEDHGEERRHRRRKRRSAPDEEQVNGGPERLQSPRRDYAAVPMPAPEDADQLV